MHTFTRLTLITPLLLISACDVKSSNGNDIRLEQPFVLSSQGWEMTQETGQQSGDRICTVSAGELDVTVRSHKGYVTPQVGTSNNLDPGDSYKVLAGHHNYESSQGWFNPQQSQAIIKDLLANKTIYTETRKRQVGMPTGDYRSIDNKIPMDGFASLYRTCGDFVKKGN